MNTLSIIAAALLGLLVGSIINLLADYLPSTLRIGRPRYPDGALRPPLAWVGVLAFALGRRAAPGSQGGARLSWRYPLTEVVTALIFALVAADSSTLARALFLMGSVAILVLITVIDLEHRMILYVVILPACVYALVGAALLGPQLFERVEFRDYLWGGLIGFGLFAAMYLGGIVFSYIMAQARGEPLEEVAFGDGDVLLAALAGFMLGWQALIFAVTIAVFVGGLGALLYLVGRVITRGRYELFTALPYGQYIVFGTLIMLLWRTPLVNWLQGR